MGKETIWNLLMIILLIVVSSCSITRKSHQQQKEVNVSASSEELTAAASVIEQLRDTSSTSAWMARTVTVYDTRRADTIDGSVVHPVLVEVTDHRGVTSERGVVEVMEYHDTVYLSARDTMYIEREMEVHNDTNVRDRTWIYSLFILAALVAVLYKALKVVNDNKTDRSTGIKSW